MKFTLRWIAALVALSFAVAACGSDGEAADAGADSEQTETDAGNNVDEATSDDAMSDQDATDDAASDDAMTEDATTDGAMTEDATTDDAMADDEMSDEDAEVVEDFFSNLSFVSLFWPEGTEPSAEVLSCIESKGVDPLMSPFEATDEEMNAASMVITGCAPDQMAESMSADVTPPAGTTIEDVKCVMRETFAHIGTLPIDVALAMTDDTEGDIPDTLQQEITPKAEAACNLSVDQIKAIFAA